MLPETGLSPVPAVRGQLRISVVYPDSLARVEVQDSCFSFGSVGDGTASLRINGAPPAGAPNGGWIAWILFPHDSIITLNLEARTETDSARRVTLCARGARRTEAIPCSTRCGELVRLTRLLL
jgi:hypothetical protein